MADVWIQPFLRMRAALANFAQRRRRILLAAGFLGLSAGIVGSARAIDVDWETVRWSYIALIAMILAPISIWLNGYELQTCAAALGREIPTRKAVFISSFGTVANVLPAPASLAIRGRALVQAGARVTDAAKILAKAALLWIFLSVAVTGLSLPIGVLAIGLSLFGSAGALFLLWRVWNDAGFGIATRFCAVRLGMIVIFVLRILVLFAALDIFAFIADASVLSGVGVIGSIVAIVPAGLGVSEGAGALVATLRDASPSAAFLVLSINRIIGLLTNGAACLALAEKGAPIADLEGVS